ncbi:PqiC family protein [Cribrihabitans neustonicus]|uniref:PqiC family protein n=1 Tax=Cribrihabitans neustonicus TaxID=1429085 RepID=UPI003B5B58ED
MRHSLPALFCATLLAACGASNDARYLITAAPGAEKVRVRAQSVEMRLVSLPAYAAAVEIVAEGDGGALFTLPDAVWADDPARGITAALARGLAERSTAEVAVEPWPLNEGPDARIDVRIDQAHRRAGGLFVLAGQYAVSSPEDTLREFLRRFEITVPAAGEGPTATAQAMTLALAELSGQMAAALR